MKPKQTASQKTVDALVDEVKLHLRALQDLAFEANHPITGPKAFFHHCSHTLTRTRDVRWTVTRLLQGRARLTEIGIDISAAADYSEVTGSMRQDFETLYLFGQLLLDQWSHVALRVGGWGFKRDKAGAFVQLVKGLESGRPGPLQSLWGQLQEPMLWLYWQLRLYRNVFVTHADRPWQRGTTAGGTTNTFKLFTPSPVGWADYTAHEAWVRDLWDRAPSNVKVGLEPGRDPRGVLLERLLSEIGKIDDRSLRYEIGECFEDMGGGTPTFQTVAMILLEFVRDGTEMLVALAADRPTEIEL